MSSTRTQLRYTPIRDLVRFRITGRLDWRGRIAAAELPESVRSLVLLVVRRTRLWKLERAEIADELIAHFRDGLAADTSAEELITSFGDPRQAAKLIRRAKIRNRPMIWHAWRFMLRMGVALIIFYAGLSVYFFHGHPSPSVSYTAEMNRPILQTPVADRAWPIYRNAILSLRGDSKDPAWAKIVKHDRDGKHWPEMSKWLTDHAEAMEQFRLASDKPAMGFMLGPGGSAYDSQMWPNLTEHSDASGPTNGSLLTLLLPYLGELRSVACALAADAKLATEQQDAARADRDVNAILSLSLQARTESKVLVDELVALGIDTLAINALNGMLVARPELLSEDQLNRLAHRLSAPKVAADLISFSGERAFFCDAVQRMYTDDGHGDGRITFDGLRFLGATRIADPSPDFEPFISAAAPASMLLMASRRDTMEMYNRLMDVAEEGLHHPLREVDPQLEDAEQIRLRQSMRETLRYPMLVMLMPALSSPHVTAERALGLHDGVLTGIALEIYHRRHGQYPQTLAELTPDPLPQVSVDRITGDPVKYRLINGKPIVYSVGANRKDDGGVLANPHDPFGAAVWNAASPRGGDWILYPNPRRVVEEDDD